MEFNSLFVGFALLILLAVTSMRFGVDSRDGFRTTREELNPRGIAWDTSTTIRKPRQADTSQTKAATQAPAECFPTPCPA